jgi:hypothetical protein
MLVEMGNKPSRSAVDTLLRQAPGSIYNGKKVFGIGAAGAIGASQNEEMARMLIAEQLMNGRP